jgi:hypothetical protein
VSAGGLKIELLWLGGLKASCVPECKSGLSSFELVM